MDEERDNSEIRSNYDRDTALWEEKFDFLENQKKQAKRDLQDAQRKFEMTIEQLQRKDSSERGKSESAQMLLISSIEKKYKEQISELTSTHAQTVQELTLKCKQLDKDYKSLQERYELETRGKLSDYSSMEKKLKDLIDTERKLHKEIEILKNDRDKRTLENQSVLEREKEIYKRRIEEVEMKAKESESRRSNMMFEFEKEKARWNLEKDHMVTEIEELQEQYKKAKKRKDALTKEVEKLKNDFRTHRRFLYSSGLNSSNAIGQMASKHVDMAKASSKEPLVEANTNSYRPYKSPKYQTKYISDGSNSKRG